MVTIQAWGTRGSFPNTSAECSEFGGDTSCFSIANGTCRIVLDAGTGIVRMGQKLSPEELHKPIYLFLSHVHLDHIQGLFFFSPLFDKETQIHIYGERRDGFSIREQIDKILGPPYWPIRLTNCGADIRWHDIRPGETYRIEEEVSVGVIRANHPNQGDLFLAHVSGKTIIYGLDSEMDSETLNAVCQWPGAVGCDLLICDAFYTPEEQKLYVGRGHGSWEDGIKLAEACKAKRLLCSHHNYYRTDPQLFRLEREAQARRENVAFARQDKEIFL